MRITALQAHELAVILGSRGAIEAEINETTAHDSRVKTEVDVLHIEIDDETIAMLAEDGHNVL